MKFSFFDEPTAVVQYLQGKKPELHFDYDEIMHDAHRKAFTVAKITDLDLLKDMQISLSEAYKKGVVFDEWKKQIKPKLAAKGWLGKTVVKNPKTGEEKEIYVGNRRLKTIYNTNMRTSYAKARYESGMEASGEYFRYVAVLDRLTRPAHKRMHGVTLPKTDSFWDINYPPNGWNCRCKVQVLTKKECESKGITPLADGSFVPNIADSDFSYNPGKLHDRMDEILKQKQDGALKTLQSKNRARLKEQLANFEHERDMFVWQNGLDSMVDEVIVKNNAKAPINMVQVGFLNQAVANIASKILSKDIEAGGIILTKKELTHAAPKRKETYNHALRVEEIRKIPQILADDSKAYVDLRSGKDNLLFVFEDKKDSSRVNLIPIEVDKIHKKFKQSNYVITLDKFFKKELITLIKKGEIVKIK